MSVTVITQSGITQVLAAADRWTIDDKGYLTCLSREPAGIVAQFAPSWLYVIDNDLEGTTS